MTIRDDARQEAERRWPDAEAWHTGVNADREWRRRAFIDGASWASEQDDREPSDAEVLCECGFSEDLHDGEFDAACGAFRPDREPSDAEVEAAANAIVEASFGQELPEAPIDLARAALLAAQAVRRAD